MADRDMKTITTTKHKKQKLWIQNINDNIRNSKIATVYFCTLGNRERSCNCGIMRTQHLLWLLFFFFLLYFGQLKSKASSFDLRVKGFKLFMMTDVEGNKNNLGNH